MGLIPLISTLSRRLAIAALMVSTLGGAALAQSPACNAWRQEYASLQGRGGGNPGAAQQARAVGSQLNQLAAQYQQMGCERGFSFFGEAPHPACGGMRARLGQLQGQYESLMQQSQGGAIEQRRAQLAAAIQNNCGGGGGAGGGQRGFFETIFGLDNNRGGVDSTMPELDPEQPQQTQRLGGSYGVCVRSCDGFFFPLANSPGGREGADEMCQSLCPGTETRAFFMQNGGDIQNAVSRGGTPYASLPNAGRYLKSYDSACGCRGQGQSWSQALQNAEYLLDKRKGDVIVTEQRAAELSRPKPDPRQRNATPAPAPASIPSVPDEKPMVSEDSPTSGTESAGVGPASVGEKVRDRGDGVRGETRSVTGERRQVRIVAPNLAPNLGAAAQERQIQQTR